jgi:hypothetical protein
MTAELNVYQQQPNSAPSQLVSWAEAARSAHQLVAPLVTTDFVPAHFRPKNGTDDALRAAQASATAAVLFGAEIGMSPMASLQSIFVISGRPGLYARVMRALVLNAGHEMWTEDSSDSKAVVCGRRRGSSNVERVTVTMEQARKAGWTKNAKYQTEPATMLLARADSQAARRVAPDALLGMPMSMEEMEDEAAPTTTITRADAKPKPVRRALAPTPIEPSLDNDSQDEQPARPVEDREDVRVFITDPQSKKLHAALNSGGYTDRALGLAFISDTVGRDVDSSKNLTREEASRVIDALEHAARPAEPPLDEEWPTTAQPGGAE